MKNWYDTQLKTLIGATIVQAGYIPCQDFDGNKLPVLVVSFPDGSKATLLALQDAEANGPGWIEVQPTQG